MTFNRNTPATRDNHALHEGGLGAGSLLGQSLAALTKEQAANLTVEIAKTRLALEEKARRAEIEDYQARNAVQLHIETFGASDKRGRLTRHEIDSTIKTGAGEMNVQSRSGSPCFVATAAYGDTDHADVVYLRGFRDRRLKKSVWGRRFIAWYYRRGPALAARVMRSVTLKSGVRASLSILVRALQALEGSARRPS